MRRLLILSCVGLACIGLAGCGGGDWRATTIENAEKLVREQLHDPSVKFAHVQVTGDSKTGQACGYYEKPNAFGGTDGIRFIFFIDGSHGQNPYIDSPSAPYPLDKTNFAPNWQEQCVKLGYTV